MGVRAKNARQSGHQRHARVYSALEQETARVRIVLRRDLRRFTGERARRHILAGQRVCDGARFADEDDFLSA